MRPLFKALRAFAVDDNPTQTVYWCITLLQCLPNDGTTVYPQTQILSFYIIFSLSSHRWYCLSLSMICTTNGLGLGLLIKVTAKQDQTKAERD